MTVDRRLPDVGRVGRAIAWTPVVVGAAFAAFLAISHASIVHALAWNADLVSPLVMATSLGSLHGPRAVVFGTYAPYTSLWFDYLTRHLPFHRSLWETGPLVLSLAGLALLGWAAWRLAGRWAAGMTFAVALACSTPVLVTLAAQADHGTSYFVVCLLAAFLVLVTLRPLSVGPLVAATAGVGLVAGVNLASDPLLLLVGIVPFLGAPLIAVARWRTRAGRRVLVVAASASALCLVVGQVTSKVMRSGGFAVVGLSRGSPLALATPSQMTANAQRMTGNVLRVFNAYFLHRRLAPASVAAFVLTGPVLVAVALPVVAALRSLRTRTRDEERSADARTIYLAFWGLEVMTLGAGLVFSRLAVENAARSISYLTPLFIAAVVTLPLVTARAGVLPRAGVGVGAGVFCALSLTSLIQHDVARSTDQIPFVKDGPRVLAVLKSHDLHRGYAAYASASPLAYKSGGVVDVYPVLPCLVASGRTSLCGFFANRSTNWYVARPGSRTFVIGDPTLPAAVPVPPPAELGTPTEVYPVGSQTVYVYPYDVAARFGATL